MSATVRVYINGRGVDAPAGGIPVDAVRLVDPTLASAVAAGDKLVTDSRGLPVPAAERMYHGAIYRVIANRSRSTSQAAAGGDADATQGDVAAGDANDASEPGPA